jgi:LysM repeat protein
LSLQTLQAAFASATWPVVLNATYLTDNGVTPPAGFDALLTQAFVLGDALGLSVGQGQVGAVAGDSFTITAASLPNGVFGAVQADTTVTLTFTLPTGGDLLVQIRTDLSNWTFATGFPWMVGGVFDDLNFSQASLLFSTAIGTASWPAAGGATIALTPGMTFAGALNLSLYAQTVLQIANLAGAAIPNPLVMSGPIDASVVNDDTPYPVMDLTAPLSAATFTFLFLEASAPFFGFVIEPAPPAEGPVSDDDAPEQPVSYVFGGVVTTTTSPPLALQFTVQIQSATNNYAIALAPPEGDSTPLTPANIATIAGVNASYIVYVPAPLQSFFTEIAFKGLSVTSVIPKGQTVPTITSTAVSIGTLDGFSYQLIDDPSGNFDLVIKSLDLHWTVLNPTGASRQLLLFETTFTFMPTVFTDAQGNPGGEFALSIDQDFTILAEFQGQVSLANLLPAVTGGLVQMPDGVSVIFSDVQLMIDPPNTSYGFSFGVDVTVDIITWNGQPLIRLEGMRMALSAQTPQPTQPPPVKPASTTYSASMSGLMAVGPIAINMLIAYEGQGPSPQWRLQSSLAAPLDLGSLLRDLFAVTDLDKFLPDFLPKTLIVDRFAVGAIIPTATNAKSQYTIAGALTWETTVLPGLPIACTADLALAYDGSKAAGSEFSGSVLGTISVAAVQGLTISIAYAFNQPGSAGGSTLAVQWAGVTGTYDSTAETITVTLNGWSLGSLITSLVQLTGRSYFSLSGPWSVLNSISLDGLFLTFHLAANAPTTVSAGYTLSSPIDLGFLVIDGFNFARDPKTGKILFTISGRSPLSSDPAWEPLFSNDPTKGQDVTKMPEVPGRGNALFDLRLLALGQHVSINAADMSSTQAVIKSLEQIPSTGSGSSNPVDPTSTQPAQPRYNADSNWLIATDIGLFRVGGDTSSLYSIELMVVFNDPDLYGLRLGFNGDKIPVLKDLAIDIMYKKVTPTIGVYQLDLVLPGSIRQLNFGALNITLPTIGIAIYTNGDFTFDLGFPYNMDFSGSFTIQAIVGPFPVMGSGGFYFSKLSNATSTKIPKTTKGTFDPVIEFGIGLQMGLGYSIDKGILSAGFSVTFFGIIQGVFAPWHPYDGSNAVVAANGTALATTNKEVQADNYFWLRGQFGIQGKLYGTINFAIISASVSVSIVLALQITYESYRAIPMSVSASVSVSVSVKIDLGLFSFSISFSFATTISEDMTIGSDSTAPWDPQTKTLAFAAFGEIETQARPRALERPARVALQFGAQPRVASLSASASASADAADAAAAAPTLTIVLTPQFTVLAPDMSQLSLANQQGAFVTLFSMDAPTAAGAGNATGSSFAALCDALLPWVIASHPVTPNGAALAETPVSVDTLKEILAVLADPAQQPALATSDILAFLKANFTVNLVTKPSKPQQDALKAGAVIFPVMPGLTLTVPSPSAPGDTVTIDFEAWTAITPAYRTAVIATFDKLAATLNNEINAPAPKPVSLDETPESLAQVLFEDAFAMISRQLLQAAIDCYASFPYALRPGDSLDAIMAFVQTGEANPRFTFEDLVNGNQQNPLTVGGTLYFDGVTASVQSRVDGTTTIIESLSAIAARFSAPQYTTTPAALIVSNQNATNLLQAGVTITIGAATVTTALGDSFAGLAAALNVSIDVLAAQTSLYDLNTLLLVGAPLIIPTLVYTTVAGDTLGGLLGRFGVGTTAFVARTENLALANIFDASQEPLVHLSKLDLLTGDQLSQGVAAGETVGQTAGMVSRFMLQGLRLPNSAGLTLSSKFLYPTNQSEYGLYQLTGQQFPITAYGVPYSVTLNKDTTTLGWVQVNGSASDNSGDVDLTQAAANLDVVLNWAVTYGYNPSASTVDPDLTLAPEPALALTPQQFAAASYAPWNTSGADEITQITAPPGTLKAAATGGSGQAQPYLWRLAPALLSRIETQQAALTADMPLSDAMGYLPVFAPATLTTDPATQVPIVTAVDDYAYATRIDFQIRKLEQAAGAQTPTANANTVLPPGDGNTPPVTQMAPNVYQLIGPTPSDAILLERILIELNTLGPDIVNGLLVAYADQGSSIPGLVGHAASDVYSFITRSNLSTKANPPPQRFKAAFAVDEAPPLINDLFNQPADAIRLLWEISTVQSGGFSFYWDELVKGAQLPPGVFDSAGYATLTLVVTYARSAATPVGARLSNVCNSILTSTSIDPTRSTLVLVSESAPNTAAFETGDSLARFAVRYGMTAGEVARDNPQAALNQSAQIVLNGMFHEVTPADVASGDVWTTVATYYSKNAAAPITPAQLQAYNPNVTAALYAVLMIPSVTYVAAAGDSFSSVAGYFGLTLEQVGAMAQSQTGLLAGAPTLNVDPQSFSANPSIGVGNVGLRLTRANLGTPGDSTDAAYGQDYMFSLYSLLDAGFLGNQFFSLSAPGLPFGPTGDGSSSASNSKSALMRANAPAQARADIRNPTSRRTMLQSQAASPTIAYQQALNVYNNSKINPAPTNPQPNLPPAAQNPYRGVGGVAQLGLRWLDLFGNQTVTPFNAPPAGYDGPLNNPPVAIAYTDTLIALSQWPNVSASYLYKGSAGAPQLEITLALNTDAYQPTGSIPAPAAANDAKVFAAVYYQLNQDYDGQNVPGVSGPAVTFSLLNSLTGGVQAMDPTLAAKFVAFANQCAQTTAAAAAGTAPSGPVGATLTVPIDLAQVVADNVVRLRLFLMQTRNPRLVDARLLDLDGGVTVQTEILPYSTTAQDSQDALKPFAQQMETAFVTSAWQYRVGAGPADPDEPLANQLYTVWATRFAAQGSTVGLTFTVGDEPVFYTPKPVAKSQSSGTVTLPAYVTGKGLSPGEGASTTFTGVDLNVWCAQALTAIDTFLSPTYAAPAFIVAALAGQDPDQAGDLFEILALKAALAETISGTIEPVLVGADSPTLKAAAKEELKQSLLQQLGNASAVTSVAVVPVTGATTNEAQPPGTASPPAFYGAPVNTAPPLDLPNYALSAASIALNAKGAASTDSAMAFLFTCSDPTLEASIPLTLSYQLTHLQNDITKVPGIDGYRQSSWIAFTTGPFGFPIGSGPLQFPVPLRALPPPPTAQGQTGAGSVIANPTPAQLSLWDYTFTYTARRAAQDSLLATVSFNAPVTSVSGPADPETGLFVALANLIGCAPPIFADFNAYLTQVAPDTKPTSATYVNAAAALTAWKTLVSGFSTAYADWAKPPAPASPLLGMSAGPPPVSLKFRVEVAIEDDQAPAVIVVTNVGGASAPLPVIQILPDTFTAKAVTPPPGALAAYQYTNNITGAYLTTREAKDAQSQTIAFPQLSAILFQSADTAIQIQRNVDLENGAKTNDAFVFTTTPVAFATPITPLIRWPTYSLATLDPPVTPPAPISTYLNEFFGQLLGADGATYLTTQIGADGRYPLNSDPASPVIDLPIGLMPPTAPTSAALGELAGLVDGWLLAYRQPLAGIGATLSFEVILYSTLPGATMPLVKVSSVYIALDDVS